MSRDLLLKALSFFTSIGLAVSGYFFTQTFQKMDEMRHDITALQIHASRMEVSAIAHPELGRVRDSLDTRITEGNQRIISLEENNKIIREFLVEIRADIKQIKEGQGHR